MFRILIFFAEAYQNCSIIWNINFTRRTFILQSALRLITYRQIVTGTPASRARHIGRRLATSVLTTASRDIDDRDMVNVINMKSRFVLAVVFIIIVVIIATIIVIVVLIIIIIIIIIVVIIIIIIMPSRMCSYNSGSVSLRPYRGAHTHARIHARTHARTYARTHARTHARAV